MSDRLNAQVADQKKYKINVNRWWKRPCWSSFKFVGYQWQRIDHEEIRNQLWLWYEFQTFYRNLDATLTQWGQKECQSTNGW